MTAPAADSYVLRVLGPTELLGRGGVPVEGIVRQPKQLALLTYLAITTAPGFRRRDQVIALFWPDFDQAQARTRLRKALHGLREELGADTVLTRGEEEVRVDPARVWCDAVALEALVAQGSWRDAAALFRGPLLDGLFVEGVAQEFEEWLDEQRARLKRLAAQATWELSKEEEGKGDRKAAAALARRALELTPDDEEGVRRLMILLDAQGDRGGALLVYTQWQKRMMEVYGVEPAPETRKVARRVQAARKGESHETPPAMPPVVAPAPAADAAGSASSVAPVSRPAGRMPRGAIVLAAGVIVLALAGAVARRWATRIDPRSVAVLPLRTIGGAGAGQEATRLAEELASALERDTSLVVRAASRARGVIEAGTDVDGIAAALGVAYVVDGAVQRDARRLRATLRLVRAGDAVSVWAGTFDASDTASTRLAPAFASQAAAEIASRVRRAAASP